MSQKKYSLLYPDINARYRTLSDVTMHDLGMDQLCKKLSAKEQEQNYIQNVMARIYADPAVTQYRCDIFEDVLRQKKMRDDLMEILGRISFLKDYGSFNREYDEGASIWDLLHRLDEINDYIRCVDALHTCLTDSDIHSAGFLGLKAYVEKIYADNGFTELKKDISELKVDTSQLKSITVGINLNDRFEADGIGLISVNSKYFTKSGILSSFYDHIASKDRINDDTIWKRNFKFQPFDVNADGVINTPVQKAMDTGVMLPGSRSGVVKLPEGDQAKDVTRYTDRIVNHMVSHMVKRVREVLNKYVSITITDMTDLIPELIYYIKWAEYIQKLQEQGFTFSPVTGIYTHFPADEDKTLDLGRLGEECKRFKAIYEEADSRSLLLMNESFSTTSFEEGYYIAKDSVRAILHKGMRTIYNTHMHKLAFDVEEMNEEQQKAEYTEGKAFSMIVHMKGTERSYQIEVAPPEGKSYASEIAQKYGVTYEMLVK